jgi:hypothetical protein
VPVAGYVGEAPVPAAVGRYRSKALLHCNFSVCGLSNRRTSWSLLVICVFGCGSSSARISPILTDISRNHQINDSMKTTNSRTVEELSLDVNAPTVTPTKVQNDKIVRALKKLSVADPDETLIVKMVSAFVALGINPQAKSSSWLARRLKNHLQAFGLAGAPSPAVTQEPTIKQSAVKQQEPAAIESAKTKGKKANKKE